MRLRADTILLAGTALALTGAALSTGSVTMVFATPLVAALGFLARQVQRGAGPYTAGGIAWSGLATLLAGAWIAVAGAALLGLGLLAAGLVLVQRASRLSLAAPDARPPEPLPARPGARLVAGVAADEGLRLLWEVLRRMGRSDPRAAAADLRAAAARHAERGWIETPSAAHPLPPALEKSTLGMRTLRTWGEVEHLTFASEYEPQDPEIRDAWLACQPNRTAHVHLWRHGDRPRPTLLCVHGYGMGHVGFDARVFDLRWLHRELGLDLALPALPLHGPRSKGRRSGAGFLDGHPLATNAALGQAVWDLRRLTGWLRGQGVPAVGVYGMSLGAYTAALYAALERGLGCAIAAVPLSDLAALTWQRMDPLVRDGLRAAGVDEETFGRASAPYQPLRFAPGIARERRLIVAALADRICPPDQARALIEHWEDPRVHWFPGTHLAWIGRPGIRRAIEETLRATLLAAPVTRDVPLTRFRGSR